ncbi:hypothetical protein [Hyalangium gracile]|uniref:hypothetical protein n=1 Tax=Hyalangium gracile TaxID=394092 RepID=UPI001CCC3FDE|nr:hypothetical protein [Hyalangium gracile]
MLGRMDSGLVLTLGFLAVIVLVAGGASLLLYQRKVRRQLRQSTWKELSLRLELAPQPGKAQVARGELPDTDFLLHDTGADWLVELPLARPLLPPGLVLLSPNGPTLQPRPKLRPLRWSSASMSSELLACYVDPKEPPGRVQASQAFLEEASRAAQAHDPLRVESRRLIQALRAGDRLSMNQVREAVRALHTTARGWLTVAERDGLPQVQPLTLSQPEVAPPSSEGPPRVPEPSSPKAAEQPEPPRVEAPPAAPPARAVPQRVPPPLDPWNSLGLLNGAVPIAFLLTLLEWEWVLIIALLVSASVVQAAYDSRRIGGRGVVLWLLMWSTTLGAPLTWGYSQRWGTGSIVFPFLGLTPHEDGGLLKLLALLMWGVPNLVWLSWVIKETGQELRALRAPPSSEAAGSPQQVPAEVQPVSDEPPRGKKRKKKRSSR